MSYWGFPRYVSVSEKKAKAARKLRELSKKNPNLKPVILQGTSLVRSWWGKAWNLNLERYADFENRIGRGRSYVRHGAVLDLQIAPGEVRALVQGSQSKPYSVVISIKKLRKEIWQTILEQCQGMLESLQELLSGRFPKAIGEIFTHRDSGMFPSSKEITFNCSCPDWAGMCKHVAATLYGIGARLDESPELFFTMRNVAMDDLIRQAVTDHKEKLLARASRKSSRIIDEADLSATFGIALEQDIVVVSSASSGDTVPSSPRKGKRAGSSGRVTSPAKSPSRAKGLKGTKKAVAKDTAKRGKRTVKAKSDKMRKVTRKAKK
jgi:uncharacterized Zn finger protein